MPGRTYTPIEMIERLRALSPPSRYLLYVAGVLVVLLVRGMSPLTAAGVAAGLAGAIGMNRLLSSLQYMPSSPTLFNAGTMHEQLSSCFLLDSPQDTLESIYSRYADIAMAHDGRFERSVEVHSSWGTFEWLLHDARSDTSAERSVQISR